MRILLIEDNIDLSRSLAENLEVNGFTVDCALDGEEGSKQAHLNEYDAIILDINLPKKSGIALAKELRDNSKDCPILVLSVHNDVAHKASLLRKYVDDYVTKPFAFVELLARLRALLRRPKEVAQEKFTRGDFTIDINNMAVWRGKRRMMLTRKEFMLFSHFMRYPNQVHSRGDLLDHVWGNTIDPFSNTLEAHISNLRRKLGATRDTSIIRTVAGVGYQLDIKK